MTPTTIYHSRLTICTYSADREIKDFYDYEGGTALIKAELDWLAKHRNRRIRKIAQKYVSQSINFIKGDEDYYYDTLEKCITHLRDEMIFVTETMSILHLEKDQIREE